MTRWFAALLGAVIAGGLTWYRWMQITAEWGQAEASGATAALTMALVITSVACVMGGALGAYLAPRRKNRSRSRAGDER